MSPSPNHFDLIEKQRRTLAAALLSVGSAITLFFALFNLFVTGFYLTAAGDAVMAATFGYLLLTLKQRRDVQAVLRWTVLFFVAMLLLLALYTQGRNMNLIWLLAMPVLFFIVFGCRGGVLWSVVMGGVALLLSLLVLWQAPPQFNAVAVINIIGVYLTIGLMAYFYEKSRQVAESAIIELALTDPLSGIGNRRYLVESCEREIAEAQRYGYPLSFIIIDIDYFKLLNDRYGHHAGDAAICYLTGSIGQRLRKSDLFGRLGGEEFAIVLPHTALGEATALAEGICHRIDAENFNYQGETIEFTISLGVALLHPGRGFAALYQEADKALYRAKAEGRNRVVAWPGA